MVTLKNDKLTVLISEIGAEVHSVKNNNGDEFMWIGDKNVWGMHAPVLFPICGGVKDDKYVLYGKEYTLAKHGFARFETFSVEDKNDTECTFLYTPTEETKKSYPFDYELRLIYKLCENSLSVSYKVTNKSDVDMYYTIGAHEGYLCEDGIENYDIVFEQNETLGSYVLDGNLLTYDTIPVIENTNILPLKYDYFAVDALVFKDVKSNSVALKHRNSSRKITVDIKDFDVLLFWTKPGAKYICIEPWTSHPDNIDSDYDFTKKYNVTKLGVNETKENAHTITFEK